MSNKQILFLKNKKKEKLLVKLFQLLIVVVFFLSWELLVRFEVLNSFIFSSPSLVINTVINLINENNFFIHIFVTLYEVLIAFILGIVIGLVSAIILYRFNFLAKVVDPFLTLLNSLPKVCLGPILIIWTGANTSSIIFMALLINVIVSIITIYNGFLNTDLIKIKLLQSLGASKWQILTKLVIPQSYSTIISSLKLNISMSLIGVIMGEFLVSKKGIGYLIIYGTQVFNLNLVMSGILILIIISFVLYKGVYFIEKKMLHKI